MAACAALTGDILAPRPLEGLGERQALLELLQKEGGALADAEDEYKRDPDVVLAAVARDPGAIAHACPELLADRFFLLEAVARSPQVLERLPAAARRDPLLSAKAATPSWRGERLRLVGGCTSWRTTDALLRLRCDGAARQRLTVHLRDGCLSFQLLSCVWLYGLRVLPVRPKLATGSFGDAFRLRRGDRSSVPAEFSPGDKGQSAVFRIIEEPGSCVTIFAELDQGRQEVAVWFDLERDPNELAGVASLSQVFGRHVKRPQEALQGSDLRLLSHAEAKPEFAGLLEAAQSLSAASFGKAFVDAAGGKRHVTLLTDKASTALRGYCVFSRLQEEDPQGCREVLFVEEIAVAEGHRGHGLGRRLVEWAMGWARFSKCQVLRLAAVPSAVDFYRRLGFERLQAKADGGCTRMERSVPSGRS